MRLNDPSPASTGFTKLASFVIIAAVLYFAKEVFIPIALASLLSFLLAPLVVRLGRWGLGKIPSILLVVALASGLITVVGWLVMAQLLHLGEQLPNYQQNLHAKVLSIRKPHGGGLFAKTTSMLKALQKEVDSLTPDDDGTGPNGVENEKALPVEIKKPKPTPFEVIENVAGPVLKPLATAGAVVFFVILMLFQREDLRERFLKLVSGGELNVATQAVDDATQRVSRYLLMQLIVNVCYGLPIGVGLYFIGVPNAFLWGLLATLLRFIPFVGPWIAASFPMILAFAVDPGWSKVIMTLGLYLVVEVLSNNIIEPWLYGASTGVSNIALLVAAIFWTWLWGTVGLLLSTPLTVCLLVLGKYVPGLSFLSILLGSEPVLEPEARFYQRMLAMDEEELLGLSEKFLEDHSVAELYDNILVPALGLAEEDRHKGALAELRQAFIVQNTRELIEMLADREPLSQDSVPISEEEEENKPVALLCIPAKDEADELAAFMLEQLLTKKGIRSRALSVKTLTRDIAKQIRKEQIQAVCISGIPPFAVTPARLICRRLKQEFPKLKVVVGIWSPMAQPTEVSNRLGTSFPDALVTRLADAANRLEAMLQEAPPLPAPSAAKARADAVEGVQRLRSLEPEPEEVFDSVTREAANILNVPVSLVSVIDTDQQFWKTHGGLPPDLAGSDGLRETTLCVTAATAEDVMEVEDVTKDDRFANDPLLQERGVRFYAGVPLRSSDGHVVGTLCITDTEPHQVSEQAKQRLRALGEKLIRNVERQQLQPA
jgi:predicted PurR-regulated permease PerM